MKITEWGKYHMQTIMKIKLMFILSGKENFKVKSFTRGKERH